MNKRFLKHTFSLLHVDHVHLDRQWNYKNVISPYHRIYYIDQGEGQISDSWETFRLEPGYLYFIPSYTLCNLVCESSLSQYFVQFFEESADGSALFSNVGRVRQTVATESDISNFHRLIETNPGRGIIRSNNPKVYEKEFYYKAYQELNNQQNLAGFIETQGILLQLLSRFASTETPETRKSGTIPTKILDAMHFIVVNLHLPITVGMLADRAHLNSEYFSRLFEKHTGVRPMSFIIEKRIERVVHVMATSKASNKEIATLAGFESLSHFIRTFKKAKGVAPGMYRRRLLTS
ncbi:MAG: AraC family transcriptional regulator [Dyadobacter sp. 50-39]|uniref:helix-turn-helix domain-containing protein n=1 Tax=Dyadobacter sp. 50-39 TaxID=1895756 RepID=UPI00096A20E0|nr:AraC family transcriptional regulator [Dyadobacter sp. 50-39]OJV19387.1 MAG: AraC family transcriptional regulator [Dyadobacter sp. 50-39]